MYATFFAKPVFKLFLLALMGLVVAYPLLQPAMLCGADFPGHLAHAVELDRLMGQGVWYPRWSPDFVFGYGYPTFNFYPPLTRYLAVAIHWLGAPLRDAVKLTMLLALLLAGPAMYLFARSIYGERAGLVAGLSYTFAPYLANNALQRFAVNETLAMSLAPLVLLAFSRLQTEPRRVGRRVVWAALAYAALIVTHTLMTFLFTAIVAAYLLLLWWFDNRSWVFIGRAALAVVLALGLTAFFWIPFVTEVGWVQMWRATILDLTGELLYPLNFQSLSDLLFPKMLWPDYGRGDPLVLRFLALPQVVLAVFAVVRVRRSACRLAYAVTALLGVVLVMTVFLITPAAKPLWDNVRVVQIVQFPWRFLAPASFSLASLAGVGWSNIKYQISNIKRGVVAYTLLIATFVVWTLPWVRPFTCAIEPNPSSAYLLWVDRNHIGGGSGGEFLPKCVEQEPTESPLEADLLAGKPVDRLDRASLPEGAQARLFSSQPFESVWEITSPRSFTAAFHNFFFLGWSVRADDVPVPIRPTPSTSLIQADLAAGNHRVALRLDPTREQVIGSVLSMVSILVALAQMSNLKFQISKRNASRTASGTASAARPLASAGDAPAWEGMTLAVIGVVALVVRLVLAGIAPSGPALPSTMARLSVDLGGQVQLLGYEFSPPVIRAGETLTTTLYWQAPSILLDSYKSFIHVTDASGQIVAQSDAVPGNWARPTYGWLPGEWVADPHLIHVPAGGALEVWAGMYDPATGQPLKRPGDESGRVRLGMISP